MSAHLVLLHLTCPKCGADDRVWASSSVQVDHSCSSTTPWTFQFSGEETPR